MIKWSDFLDRYFPTRWSMNRRAYDAVSAFTNDVEDLVLRACYRLAINLQGLDSIDDVPTLNRTLRGAACACEVECECFDAFAAG